MVNEEILGGLKSALERGQPLQKAMMALYNSGYKKEEIEEAARNLMEFRQESQFQPPVKTVPKTPEVRQAPQVLTTPTIKSFPELQVPVRQFPQPPMIPQKLELQKPKGLFGKRLKEIQEAKPTPLTIPQVGKFEPIQKISNYGQPASKEKIKEKKSSKEKIIILTLVFLLIFLLGLLGMIFVFKQQLIDFFSTFFG